MGRLLHRQVRPRRRGASRRDLRARVRLQVSPEACAYRGNRSSPGTTTHATCHGDASAGAIVRSQQRRQAAGARGARGSGSSTGLEPARSGDDWSASRFGAARCACRGNIDGGTGGGIDGCVDGGKISSISSSSSCSRHGSSCSSCSSCTYSFDGRTCTCAASASGSSVSSGHADPGAGINCRCSHGHGGDTSAGDNTGINCHRRRRPSSHRSRGIHSANTPTKAGDGTITTSSGGGADAGNCCDTSGSPTLASSIYNPRVDGSRGQGERVGAQ